MTDKEVMAAVRAAIGVSGCPYPIEMTEGDSPPELHGKSHHWTTPGGKPIHFPSAYRWRKVYHASTMHIRVGRKWVEAATWLRKGTPPEIITDFAKEI